VSTIHAFIWYCIVSAVQVVVAWVSSVTGIAFNSVISGVVKAESAPGDVQGLARLIVWCEIVVLFAVFT
jgi:hypothetical protein